jgi:hypothetical protein
MELLCENYLLNGINKILKKISLVEISIILGLLISMIVLIPLIALVWSGYNV